jgi:hypothetical protein
LDVRRLSKGGGPVQQNQRASTTAPHQLPGSPSADLCALTNKLARCVRFGGLKSLLNAHKVSLEVEPFGNHLRNRIAPGLLAARSVERGDRLLSLLAASRSSLRAERIADSKGWNSDCTRSTFHEHPERTRYAAPNSSRSDRDRPVVRNGQANHLERKDARKRGARICL